MKKETLSDAIGNIDDKLIAEAARKNAKMIQFHFKKIAAAAAVIAIAVTAVFGIPKIIQTDAPPAAPSETQSTTEISEAPTSEIQEGKYETVQGDYLSYAAIAAKYPAASENLYDSDISEEAYAFSRSDYKDYSLRFFTKTIRQFLVSEETGNAIFSPLNLFFSLSTLAEITEGESRRQILSLLDIDDLERLRTVSRSLWLSVYSNATPKYSTKSNKCIPANSFWLNGNYDISGDSEIAEILRNHYFVSFFKGDMNDENYINAYKEWIDVQTDGLLHDFSDQYSLSPDTVFSLVSTILYESAWIRSFPEEKTYADVFHSANGDYETEFMHLEDYAGDYYYESDSYTALGKATLIGIMWFILPNENESVHSVLESGAYTEILTALREKNHEAFQPREEEYDIYVKNESIPKFDFSSQFDLSVNLKELGVTDIFDREKANIPFIKMTDGQNLYLSSGKQEVRVKIDENGVAAAAATHLDMGMGDPTIKRVDFVLNRPFITLITSQDGTPIFAGVVNDVRN